MPTTVDLTARLKLKQTKTIAGTTASVIHDFDFGDSLANGVIIDQGDLPYGAKNVSLSGNATINFDVAGALSDFYGTTITAVKLKFFYFKNLNTVAGNTILLGAHATTALLLWGAAAHTKRLAPHGFVLMWVPSLAGIAVTAGTGDALKIFNETANAVNYDIAFVATSA